jgi:cathepsin F
MAKLFAALVVCLCVVALVSAAPKKAKEYDLTKHPRAVFAEWQKDHPHIKFPNAKETELRYKVFTHNIQRVKELNAQHHPRTKFMLNKFAHLSEQEFNNIFFKSKIPQDFKYDAKVHEMLPEVSDDVIANLPDSYDWRQHNPPVVTKVKDQGMCGGCWSFSTTGNIEGQWALAGHPLVSLSEQNLIDCDHECIKPGKDCDQGCDGGLMQNAFNYVIKNNGIDSEKSYPYVGYNGKCKFNSGNVAARISNWTFIPKTATQMQAYVVNQGPVAIAADAQMWQFYYTGVWYFPCGTSLDHAILIVGYGTETDIFGQEMPYWIVKNSWGADWGMDGYILIERGNDRCGLQEYPCTALINK